MIEQTRKQAQRAADIEQARRAHRARIDAESPPLTEADWREAARLAEARQDYTDAERCKWEADKLTAPFECMNCGVLRGTKAQGWHSCEDQLGARCTPPEPGTWCQGCGVGPFYYVEQRPYPTLCIDCAELVTPSAMTLRRLAGVR